MNSHVPPPGNILLSALPPAEMPQLHPMLTRVRWVNGQGLHEASERIEHMFFVEQGLASMVAQSDDGVEVGLIGRDGMVGYPVLLDEQAPSYNQSVVQTSEGALRMSASALRGNLNAMPVLHRLLSEALQVYMAQVAQTAACDSQHRLSQRLARWLLLAYDGTDGRGRAGAHAGIPGRYARSSAGRGDDCPWVVASRRGD